MTMTANTPDDLAGKLIELRRLIHPLTRQGEDNIWRRAEKACVLIDGMEEILASTRLRSDAGREIEGARLLQRIVAADIAREGRTASTMVRAGLLADILEAALTPPAPSASVENEAWEECARRYPEALPALAWLSSATGRNSITPTDEHIAWAKASIRRPNAGSEDRS